MLRAALIIAVGFACSGCQHTTSLSGFRTEPDAVFLGRGTHPSWKLKVTRTSISFNDLSGRITQKIDPAYFGSGEIRDGYRSEKISFWTNIVPCFEPESRQHLEVAITLQVRGKMLHGCGGPHIPSKNDHLSGTNWRIHSIDDKSLINMNATQVRFNYGRLIAFAGCNRLSRNYSAKDGTISFGKLQTSNVECTDLQKQQEQKFLEITNSQAMFEFDLFGNLTISRPEKGKLVMNPTR
jgi:heat shock protein HslJ